MDLKTRSREIRLRSREIRTRSSETKSQVNLLNPEADLLPDNNAILDRFEAEAAAAMKEALTAGGDESLQRERSFQTQVHALIPKGVQPVCPSFKPFPWLLCSTHSFLHLPIALHGTGVLEKRLH